MMDPHHSAQLAQTSPPGLSRAQQQGGNPPGPGTAPSPQSVGREFVRQYYTLLNQAPLHLHR